MKEGNIRQETKGDIEQIKAFENMKDIVSRLKATSFSRAELSVEMRINLLPL